MADLTRRANTILRRQHGAITITQLAGAGVSRSTSRRLELSGVFDRPFKSVRRLASSNRTIEQRCAEICLAHRQVFVTGVTAGMLVGLRKMPRHAPITVSSAHPLHIEHLGVRTRRSTKVSSADVEQRKDGISIASIPRLAFDLAADLGPNDHRSVVDQMIHQHGLDVADLVRIAGRLVHVNRRGSERFLETLKTLTETPAESDAELRLAQALRLRGVPVESNVTWLDLPDGRRARLDLSVATIRWGIEVDVHPSHLGVIGSTKDKSRDRGAKRIGWSIDRVTALDLIDLDAIADELTDLYRVRCIEFAAA